MNFRPHGNIDPISRDVFQQQLVGIAEEMSMALRRAAFSSIIWDMYDYACGLFTPEGEMMAQAETIPAQLGIMSTALSHMKQAFPLDQWKPGDVLVCNDPYKGCTHTMDIVLFSPVFLEGELIGITSTIAHHVDIGGKIPGTEAADNAEIFAEGIILPPLKLVDGGKPNPAIFDIIAANVRDPASCQGDLRAQIAGCRMGERRLAELFKRQGVSHAKALTGACLDYAETYMRRVIAAMPDGRYHASVLTEDDTTSDEPLKIAVTVEVKGDKLKVDFTGTVAQRDNALNCPIASTLSMTNYAVKCIVAPEIAQNEGCNRAVEMVAPEGSLLNPRRPAAVSVRHLTQQAVADAVLKAMAPLAPNHAAAGCQISFPTFCAGGFDERPEKRGEDGMAPYYVISDIIGGGMGGSAQGDGLDAIDTHGGNCAVLSAEVIETLSPLRVLETSLVAGSGGEGKHRGGLGIRRDYQFLSERTIMGAYVQQTRDETRPWGLEGGKPGQPGFISLNPGKPGQRPLKSKIYGLKLEKGDVMRFQGAGGGGWGDPKTRDAAAKARDQAEGFV
ncbi:N-methylhydantoinase B [Hypericibacter adhaerens]|uniref:N-methylhydantoinase B n=1 Tax=Hypericibacter adhaerens TaxID=2602016 RepID=A0A5J6MV02_9PROT|nr:hydantoinase B/oxoprolinase family protein [Hypericibacter adhaerens]QEX20575.1 N-methylhydantoinase B [Hypericibacter adhaerens]